MIDSLKKYGVLILPHGSIGYRSTVRTGTLFSWFLILPCIAAAQNDPVRSGIYPFNGAVSVELKSNSDTTLFSGSTTSFSRLEVSVRTLGPATGTPGNYSYGDLEELLIVKEGNVRVTCNGADKVLGPGSVALFMPGEVRNVSNKGKVRAVLYAMKYRSQSPLNPFRKDTTAGSMIVDWNGLVFKEHERGGIRQYFERATAMTRRFEMHVTTLKAGIKSHEPHTHGAEEIVLLLDGKAEMQIGRDFRTASAGDVIFLASNVPHALKNAGDGPCMYFAFQWE